MHKRVNGSVVLSFSVCVCLVGCDQTDNVTACLLTFEAINNLPCIDDDAKIDPVVSCPESYNSTGFDYSEYFNCLTEGYRCEDDVFMADIADCTIPTESTSNDIEDFIQDLGEETLSAVFTLINDDTDNIHILVPREEFGPGNRVVPGSARTSTLTGLEDGETVEMRAGRSGVVLSTAVCPAVSESITTFNVVWTATSFACTAAD